VTRRRIYRRPPRQDAVGDRDDAKVSRRELFELRDPRAARPLAILIAREAEARMFAATSAGRSTFHRTPPGGTFRDPREDRRREQAEAAAQARRDAWAGRRAAMLADDADRRRP
jgi:hypothetical protein